jgi:hypothetical protein
MRFRLYIRQGWTYVQARDCSRRSITTTINRQAASTWTAEEAERIGARLVHRGLTVDLQLVESNDAAMASAAESRV